MNLYYNPFEVFKFVGWTFLSKIPLWIMIYFDKKDEGEWTGVLGWLCIGVSRLRRGR